VCSVGIRIISDLSQDEQSLLLDLRSPILRFMGERSEEIAEMWAELAFKRPAVKDLLRIVREESNPARLAEAMRELGWAYVDDEGVEQDLEVAATWFGRAALLGDPESQCALGTMFACERGVPRDLQTGVHWMRLAAEQNFVDALCQLGWYYFTGNEVVPKDHRQSYLCFERAAQLGSEGASWICKILSILAQGDYREPTNWEKSLIIQLGFNTLAELEMSLNRDDTVSCRIAGHHTRAVYPDDEPDLDLSLPPPVQDLDYGIERCP
jgi:hypothetical protein